MRSNDASELKGGVLGDIRRKLPIKLQFTPADTPQYNGVTEHGLAPIERVAKVFTIQAHVSLVGMKLPITGSRWPEPYSHPSDVLNCTAITANLDNKSSYKVLYDKAPPPTPLEWLQPCLFRVKRENKTDAQA